MGPWMWSGISGIFHLGAHSRGPSNEPKADALRLDGILRVHIGLHPGDIYEGYIVM